MQGLLFHYLPYAAVDVLITLSIIYQVIAQRFDLLWAHLPILILGLISLSRKLRRHELDP